MLSKIDEIRKAIKNGLPEAALALALTLPDICGQVMFPNESNVGKRYRDWLTAVLPADAFDVNFDGKLTAANNGKDPGFSKLEAQDIYHLRCHFLHSGDADIDNKKTSFDKFVFRKIGTGDFTVNGFGVEGGFRSYIESDSTTGNQTKTLELDLDYFCEVIGDAAEKYYNSCKDKSAFDDHKVKFV